VTDGRTDEIAMVYTRYSIGLYAIAHKNTFIKGFLNGCLLRNKWSEIDKTVF